jgi:hypothetical protein
MSAFESPSAASSAAWGSRPRSPKVVRKVQLYIVSRPDGEDRRAAADRATIQRRISRAPEAMRLAMRQEP